MAEGPDYHAVLADLKARRDRLDLLISGLEATILGQTDALPPADVLRAAVGSPAASGASAIHPDSFFGLAIIEAAKKYLKMMRRAQHTAMIAEALGQGGLKRPADNVLSSILVRAAKGREVVKVGKGMWGLSEWYPKRPMEPLEEQKRRPRPPPATGSRPKKRAGTSTAAVGASPSEIALETLRAAGKPLHIRDVIRQIEARGVSAKRANLEARLNRWVKAGKLKKPAPGTFAI